MASKTLIHGRTFSAGRNAEKRAAREDWRLNRRDEVAMFFDGQRSAKVPKHDLSSIRRQMLTNRNFRQCAGSL